MTNELQAHAELYAQFQPQIEKMGREMVTLAAKVQPDQKVLIWHDPQCSMVVGYMLDECRRIGAEVSIFERNLPAAGDKLRAYKDGDDLNALIDELFADEAALMGPAKNVIIARIEDTSALEGISPEVRAAYEQRYGEIHERRGNGQQEWCLTIWPTPEEAAQEHMSYADYFALCMEACNQPWPEIKAAQEQLITVLDAGNVLELHANEDDADETRQTHLTMSIEDMTFCNSTIDRNYPGSEVFSAPVRTSVNGQVFAEGEYVYQGVIISDLFLKFVNGQVVEARSGDLKSQEALDVLLALGDKEGNRFLGEVALGTNPALVYGLTANGLFAEKKAGSFHVALGECYTFDEYAGKPVNVDNGNHNADIHWDIAVSMVPKRDGNGGGGRVVVDGKVIQQNGNFVDPALAVLNPKTT